MHPPTLAGGSIKGPNKFVVFGSLIAWMILFGVGMRLPYLRSAFSAELRTFWIFPILMAPMVYGLVRGMLDGRIPTLFKETNGPSEKLGLGAAIILALVGGPAFFAWSSIAYPAFATWVFADRPFAQTYEVVEASKSRRYVILRLKDNRGGIFALQIHGGYVDALGSSTTVCVTGQEWLLGAIANQVSSNTASCGLSRP